MNELPSQPSRVDALLSQDEAVASFNDAQFHARLEASIRKIESRVGTLRKVQFCALGVFFLCVASAFVMQVSEFQIGQVPRVTLGACGTIALLTTGVLAAIYQYRYSPALSRANSELISKSIAELQQQVAELRRK